MSSRSSPRAASYSAQSLDGHRAHILAINNDPAILALFRDLLEEAGYHDAIRERLGADRTLRPIDAEG